MNQRRLAYYLLLNIFVSACVTLTILYWYDRTYRASTLPSAAAPALAPSADGTGTASVAKGQIKIVSVVGAGTLTLETVTIQYLGDGQVDLTGWHLKVSNGNDFTFPPFQLFTQGAVRVHTVAGTNTAVDLYWGNAQAVWNSGEDVLLTDSQGNPQDSYSVP